MTITVTCRRRDPRCYVVPKHEYDTVTIHAGNHDLFLRDTHADPRSWMLNSLAAWLVSHVPGYVGGKRSHPQRRYHVRCYNGKTVAEQGMWSDEAKRTFAPMGDAPSKIEDLLFPIIEPEQTDEEYWNQVAVDLLDMGVSKIVIGDAEWTKQAVTGVKHA